MRAERTGLSLFDATMLVMGGVLGIGIFFTPPSVAQLVGRPDAFLALWVLLGGVALAGAMTFAELSATFPRAGGWYVFLREAFGPFPAFLFAWIVLFVVSTGASALVADFCAGRIVELGLPADARAPLAIGLIGLLTAVALLGLKQSAWLQNLTMVLKLAAVLALCAAGFLVADPAPPSAPLSPPPPLLPGMMRAALPVLFAYGGWQLVCYIAPHVRDPQRNLPRSILMGMGGVVAIYVLLNLAAVRGLGLQGLAASDAYPVALAQRALGPAGGTLVTLALAISSFGICAAILMASPWLYVAMAEDGLFFRAFGRLSSSTGAPTVALLVQGALAVAYALWGRAEVLTDAVVFTEWIFHALCGLALLRLRRLRPGLPRPFRSPAYPLFPLLYVISAAAVVIGSLLAAEADRTLLGLGVLAAGAAIYLPWKNVVQARRRIGR